VVTPPKPGVYRVMAINAVTCNPLGVLFMPARDWNMLVELGEFKVPIKKTSFFGEPIFAWPYHVQQLFEKSEGHQRDMWWLGSHPYQTRQAVFRCEFIALEDSSLLALMITDDGLDVYEDVDLDVGKPPGTALSDYVSVLVRVMYTHMDEARCHRVESTAL
jgi:hypothetical protein